MGCQLTNLDYNLHCLLHNLDAHKLVRTVEVAATSEDIWTWQTLERKLCTVCAATDGLHLRSDTTLLHRLEHDVDDVHVGVNLLLHVVVLVLKLNGDSTLTPLLVHLLDAILDEVLAILKAVAVVVAYDVRQSSLLTA